MTYFWSGVVILLLVGIGLIVWASAGPGAEASSSGWRRYRAQVGAVMVIASLAVLVFAYLTSNAR